jgi:hypothetical protein
MASYTRVGNDPIVGGRLVALMHDAGALPVRNTWIFFGGVAGEPNFPGLVANMAGLLSGARAAILATGRIDATAFDPAIAAIYAWGARPDAAIWFARCWAEGMRAE